jgi:CubicO group peptidase (beta-lactamase class C family)
MEHFVLRTPRRSFLPATLLLAALLPVPAAGALQGQASPDASIADSIFAEWDREGSPGCAVGAYQAGETVLARGYGEANLDWGLPITASTVFYSGSVSKQFAAATAALLHLDGTLDLDADIRSYVPELPPYDPPVTVRHLVHHTSGVRDIYGLIALAGGRVPDAWTDEEYLALLARQGELNFDPGQEYLYSNGAYYLLTTAIERSSGQRLDDVARELIFQPLGMDDTHFHQDRGGSSHGGP